MTALHRHDSLMAVRDAERFQNIAVGLLGDCLILGEPAAFVERCDHRVHCAGVTKHVGWIYRKRYAAHAVRRKRQRQLEAVVDKMVDRLIDKHFEITSDGKLQPKSTPQPRQ
jgi:hypothetical protein